MIETDEIVLMPLADVLAGWRPGSFDVPWSWDDEERDLLSQVCLCCGKPGHYQLGLEEHIREHGITQGVCLGSDGRVWDGHHRIVAARRLGITEIPLEDDCQPTGGSMAQAESTRRIDPHKTCLVHLEALPCESCSTDLETLTGLECPECGPLVDEDGTTLLSKQEISGLLGGDKFGFIRCPDCDAELEPTVAAALDMLAFVAERMAGPGHVVDVPVSASEPNPPKAGR